MNWKLSHKATKALRRPKTIFNATLANDGDKMVSASLPSPPPLPSPHRPVAVASQYHLFPGKQDEYHYTAHLVDIWRTVNLPRRSGLATSSAWPRHCPQLLSKLWASSSSVGKVSTSRSGSYPQETAPRHQGLPSKKPPEVKADTPRVLSRDVVVYQWV